MWLRSHFALNISDESIFSRLPWITGKLSMFQADKHGVTNGLKDNEIATSQNIYRINVIFITLPLVHLLV